TGPLLWNFKGVDLFDPPLATVDFQDSWGTLWSNNWAVGQVWGDGNTVRVRARLRDWSWDQSYFPYQVAIFRSASLNLTLDTNVLALTGTQSITERSVVYGYYFGHTISYSNDTSDVTFPLPDGNDGHWNLELNLAPVGNYERGTATITFANDETQNFRVNGRYSPFSGTTRLLLTGTFFDHGSFLWVTLSPPPDYEIQSMRGRVSGQKITFP